MLARLLLLAFVTGVAAADTVSADAKRVASQYVDESGCAHCHAAQSRAWAASHHALAMREATGETVLGDFKNARYSYNGVTSEFFRRDGKFFVSTDGPDSKLAEFEIKHTFGVDPLQQYLIDLPGGRKQALSIAWDTQHKRWFHLYPNERVDYRDELHWTKASQNWNRIWTCDCWYVPHENFA
jgi:hypothetical protein